MFVLKFNFPGVVFLAGPYKVGNEKSFIPNLPSWVKVDSFIPYFSGQPVKVFFTPPVPPETLSLSTLCRVFASKASQKASLMRNKRFFGQTQGEGDGFPVVDWWRKDKFERRDRGSYSRVIVTFQISRHLPLNHDYGRKSSISSYKLNFH